MSNQVMQVSLSDIDIEEIAHQVCRNSSESINFYTLRDQIKKVITARAVVSCEDKMGNTDHVGRGLDDMPQPYAGAIVLLETIAECGARPYIGEEATEMHHTCIRFANELREAGREVLAKANEAPIDLKLIHSAILKQHCDPNANRDQQYGYMGGLHRAAAVVAGFSDEKLKITYESMVNAGPETSLDTSNPPFGRFHTRRYPDGNAFTFQTHDADPDAFYLYAQPVQALDTLQIDTRILFSMQVALGGWAKRLESSEDCSDIPNKLIDAANELAAMRKLLLKHNKHHNPLHITPTGLESLLRFECVLRPDNKADMYVHPTGPYVWFEHVESLVHYDEDYAQLINDANRYRWLRDGAWTNSTHPQVREYLMVNVNKEALDAFIDEVRVKSASREN